MKIESNKNWTTCLRLNTGDGSPRVFLLNSHFLGSVPLREHGFSFYNRKIPNIIDRIPRSAATSKKRSVDDAVKRVCFLCSLFGVKLFRKRVKKSVRLKYAKIPIIKQTSAHIKRALLRASRLKGPVSVT